MSEISRQTSVVGRVPLPLLNSTPAFTLTVAQLRELVRGEFCAALREIEPPLLHNGASQGSVSATRPYLSVDEAADLGRVASSTIRLYIRKGHLQPQKVGRRIIIARAELDRFLSLNLSHVVLH